MTAASDEPTRPRRAAPASAADVALGTRMGDYVVEAVVGCGGCGVVYRARAPGGDVVAVKVLHRELVASGRHAVERFGREIATSARLVHRSLVRIFDHGMLPDGRPYLVMELLAGRSLEAHLHAELRLDASSALAIVEPVCAALALAHQHGVIHRDVKASNVFLCDDERVVLLDFGIAKLLDSDAGALSTSRQTLGTPGSMAPEQITGGPIDARTDVYGVGVLLYQLLTGERPFADALIGDGATLLQHLHLCAARPLPSARVRVAPAIDEVVTRAMSIEPTERHPTIGALATALRSAVATVDPASAAARRRCSALVLFVAAHVDGDGDADDIALADLDAIPVFVRRELDAELVTSVIMREIGSSLILIWPERDNATTAEALQPRIMAATRALDLALRQRPSRSPRVHVDVSVRREEIVLLGDTIDASTLLQLVAPRRD
jgi:serine/threonine-protein kinase